MIATADSKQDSVHTHTQGCRNINCAETIFRSERCVYQGIRWSAVITQHMCLSSHSTKQVCYTTANILLP